MKAEKMASKATEWSKVVASRKDDLSHSLCPIAIVLKTVGLFPVARDKQRKKSYRVSWVMMVYSVCFYLLTLISLWFSKGTKLRDITNKYHQFDVMFFVLTSVSYFLIVIILPIIAWLEAPGIARYLNQWNEFQENFENLFKQSLQLNLRRRATVLCIVELMFIITFELVYQMTNDDQIWVDWWVAINEWYLDVVRFFVVTAWHLVCASMSVAANNVWTSFNKECERPSPGQLCTVVVTTRSLWLDLSHLVQKTGTSMCYCFSFFILYQFVTLTFFIYHTVSNLTQHMTLDLVLMAFESMVMVFMLFIVCDSANRTTRQVGLLFREGLLTARLSSNNASVQQELELFSKAIETSPPRISLGDYVTINRTLFVSLGSMMTTYLIVLLQFNLSTDGGNHLYNISLQI